MLPDTDIKEGLSASYIKAIASIAGVKAEIRVKDHGVDGSLRAVITPYETRILDSSFSLDFQAKSTVDWYIEDEYIVYNLEAKTYKDMVSRHSGIYGSPLILILLCLPKDKKEWVTVSEKELIMKNCCYWDIIKGPMTENKSSIKIRISCKNIFEPKSLCELLDKLEVGEQI